MGKIMKVGATVAVCIFFTGEDIEWKTTYMELLWVSEIKVQ